MSFWIAVFIIVEIWYWFIYFPRAWKSGENREISDIKLVVATLGRTQPSR